MIISTLDKFIDESIDRNRESRMERFMNARIPSAKAIPDVKGSRQEGKIRNTRNYRLRVRARRERPSCRSKENVLLATARKGQGAVY